jgi:hypothetical protein
MQFTIVLALMAVNRHPMYDRWGRLSAQIVSATLSRAIGHPAENVRIYEACACKSRKSHVERFAKQ